MGNVVVLNNYQLIKSPGRHHRIVCMTGEKRGEVYYIKSKRILMGRSKQADIIIYDLQSSREHAEISLLGNNYILTDLGSNNGVVVDGRKIKQIKLKNKDRIIIGKTVYKYEIVNVEDKQLGALLPAGKSSSEGQLSLAPPKKKNKNILILVSVAVVILLLMDDSTDSKQKVVNKIQNVDKELKDVQRKIKSDKNQEIEDRMNIIMHRGVRELREGNYYRAIGEFNTALIVAPTSSRALAYKRKAKDLLDQEIDAYFDQAARDFESYHYDKVIKSYCQILRVLENFPEDERYKSAKGNIKQLVDNFEVEKNALDCY